jgi:hypothetical protein
VSSPSAPPTEDPNAARPAEEHCIDLIEAAPPPELLEQMAHADAINARLRASGRMIAFALSADGASLRIELRDTAGHLLRTLSIAEVAEIAAGGSDL